MTESTDTPALETPSAPKNMRSFLVIWIGQLISILGSGLTGFALAVWIYEKTGQATPFALTVLFGSLPSILLMPLAGSLADRWNRRWLMILSDTGNALVTLAVFLLLTFGSLEVWHIYLISLIGSVVSAFQEPAYMASVTMLVPKKDFGRASGMMQMAGALSSIVTPILAGVLFVSIGFRGIILIDFVTFFFAIGALMIVRIPQPKVEARSDGKKSTMFSDFGVGWNFLRARTGLLGLLFYYAMVNFLLNFSGVLTGPLVLSRHPASTLGLVQTVMGVGMLAGGLAMSTWGGPKKRRIPAVIGFISLAMIGLILAGLRANPVFPAAGLALMVFFIPLASGTSQAVWQTKVSPELQGRVFSVRAMLSRSMMPIAYLVAGPLADLVFEPLMREGGALAGTFMSAIFEIGPGRGIGVMFILSGLIAIIVSLVAYLNPRIRNLEEELPDAVPG